MAKLIESLNKIFEKQRIVFWYDTKAEFSGRFETLDLPEVEKIKIENNEFGIKYRIIKEEPKKKFLIYTDKPKPEDKDNWLLDLSLANYEFSAERSSLLLQEIGLPIEKKFFIDEHINFFNSKKRTEGLTEILNLEDSENTISLKMISVITGTQPDLEYILFELFAELHRESTGKYDEIVKFNLDTHFWKFIEKKYSYKSSHPTLRDFLMEVFTSGFSYYVPDAKPTLNKQTIILLNHWSDNSKYAVSFKELSDKIASDLDIKDKIKSLDYRELLEIYFFQLVEQKIVKAFIDDILIDKISYNEATAVLQKRGNKFWYPYYKNIYLALKYSVEIINLIKASSMVIHSLTDGIIRYVNDLYKIDFSYRKFVYHFNNAEHIDVLKALSEKVDNIYSNSFLLKINDSWQRQVDDCKEWRIPDVTSQREFFDKYIKSYSEGDKKIYVIISDAMRYETATELHERLLSRDRFQSELGFMLGMLPSYTQLGMAALLPNQKLSFNDKSSSVFVDDKNSSSTNREKILQLNYSNSVAIQARDLLKMSRDEGREFVKKSNIFYIYHNSIDATGDNFKTENEVFNKTEEALDEIEKIVKQITNFNGTNIIITADHGYIYQNRKLDESDFCKIDEQNEVFFSNRRFIVGKNLLANNSVRKFTSKELGLDDDTEFLIAKSINRIRVQGGGNKYVHGGASLQEITIPVILFSKKRESDISKVEIDIIKTPSKISSNQIAIYFYQADIIEEKILPREIKAGFYSKDDKLISDEVKLVFNSTDADARAREQKHKFIFKSEAKNYSNQIVLLKLQERIEGTNKFKTYKEDSFTLNISFASEFDDF